MCACDEAFGRRHRPHQLSTGSWLSTRERVDVTLGFQLGICNRCRGLREEAAPMAAIPGRTSKIQRYYWREITMQTAERFSEWAHQNQISFRPLMHQEKASREIYEKLKLEVIDKIKAEHAISPKYAYAEESSDEVIRSNNVEILRLDATYSTNASKGQTIIEDGQLLSVEDFTSHYFKSQGYETLPVESTPIHVLFACFMYPVISDFEDSYVSPAMFGDRFAFERGERGCMVTALLPSDFGTPGYGRRRADVAAARCLEIGTSRATLISEFELMLEFSMPLRQYLWAHQAASVAIARRLINILPPDRIKEILIYLIDNYWSNYLGWPDLLIHRNNDYVFVEVKGSGDKLSEEQKRWIKSNTRQLHLPYKIVKIHRQRPMQH